MAEIALAGLSYTSVAASQVRMRGGCLKDVLPTYWPWDKEWWKPSDDPTRNLVKAGALIAAEIDRLQRAKEKENRARQVHDKLAAIEELEKWPVSDPEKFMRCSWCGNEIPKCKSGICDDCLTILKWSPGL
jgi:hypothetical protein